MEHSNLLKGIKNIIFDLGGVILNIDFQKPVEAFKKLGVEDFASLYSQAAQNNLFNKLETGKISENDFYNSIRKITGLKLSDEQIKNAWNAIIDDFPRKRIEIIENLKQKYNIFLLSNTNDIHYKFYNSNFIESFGYASLDSLFHKAYFSHRIGLRKPGKEIYEFALSDSNLIPQETLFVEDTEANLIEPRKLGIKTLFLKEDTTIEEIFTL